MLHSHVDAAVLGGEIDSTHLPRCDETRYLTVELGAVQGPHHARDRSIYIGSPTENSGGLQKLMTTLLSTLPSTTPSVVFGTVGTMCIHHRGPGNELLERRRLQAIDASRWRS